ncbi:transposase-like protein [Purpureocillium lavendulum]|uniref:Transposase-like protein n=1 Tax=Purpureocillium lavendulum TaxID=1247861 RepID=A0AB34FAM1_9HYPO|nr:transposase-like protein [Purpureocillium lavendulum]
MATVAYTATCPHRLAHLADFRVFGSPGCYDKNLGIWTVVEGDVGTDECNGLNGDDVRSLSVVDTNKGCILSFFTDENCTIGRASVLEKQCANSDGGSFKGWTIKCDAPRSAKVTSIRTILEQARLSAEDNPRKRRRLNDQPGDSVDPDRLEAIYVRFIAACSPEFRALLVYLNTDVDTWLPDTHETVKKWITRQFDTEKEKVKQRIQSATSRVHISCDLWASPNTLAILGVVAHYVTEDGQLQHHTLALKDIDSEHDGSHLADAILEVIEDWYFASKLGYFVMDNAGNNDTMMKSLSLGLLRRFDIHYEAKTHRLRCQGHIINLAAKAFLFVTDNEKLEHDDSGNNATLKEIKAWRQKGPLGKLHNFVVFIQRSVQRSQRFQVLSRNRKLARDNDTRWSSWYTMLRAALNLREAIDGYFSKWTEADCAGDELSADDWIVLENVKSFLEKLKMTTKALELSFATLDNVLLAMDFMLAQFKRERKHTKAIQ